MLEYSREEILGKTILDLIPPEQEERLWSDKAYFLKGGTNVAEWTLRRKDGRYLPVEVSAKILPDGRWQGIVRDISERKRVEEALRLSEAKFSRMVSISSDAIISIDEAQRITLFNEGAEKIFGYSSAEMIGAPFDVLIPERFRAIHARHLESFMAGPDAARHMSARSGTVYGVRRDGEEFPADAAISKLSVGGKSILTVTLRDITESERLYRAAMRATQARDDVLGIVAHDLRNPLQIIVTYAGRLRRRGPEPASAMAAEIGDAANRMNRLIQDLLDVTSIESGQLSLGPARLLTAEIVSDSLKTQTPIASSASLELRVAITPDLPDIWADRDRILQVFENLIGNAIKFTKPGGRVTLGAEARAGDVVFSVSDTGSGIADGDLPHVFDRFWQASKAGRRGAGLGLAIVKGIVEAHGGCIWVRSSANQGSTFFFTIPTAPQAGSVRNRAHDKSTTFEPRQTRVA
jgi:PAS domain S-box-containing protein